jgi:uncharacterized protein YggE
MRKPGWIVGGPAALLLIGLIAVVATSAAGQSTSPTDGGPAHTISVSSFARISTAPDEAVITFGIHADDPESEAALNENSRISGAVIAAMKALAVTERDMETTNLRIAPQTINRGTSAETTIYNASTTLSVTIHDFDVIGRAIHDGVQAGAIRVSGVRFQVGDPAGAKKRALQAAVQSARAKADALAQAAGTTVTGVVQIREQGSPGNPRPYFARADTLAYDQAAALPSVVPPHDIETKVSISVVWSIT